ncbi:HD domain-containing protein [Micromonospora sp. NPDC093277]|uniref:HD domain-containing protein n=1 Tax=Micromonospora sp. NPDC093277 TaxID=3364291 RepID=UPI0037F94573
MSDLIAQARQFAADLLDFPPPAQRWSHVQAVGRRASELSVTVEPVERDLLVAAAWLHDIGYVPGLVATGFHSLDGARYLQLTGYPPQLVGLVAQARRRA